MLMSSVFFYSQNLTRPCLCASDGIRPGKAILKPRNSLWSSDLNTNQLINQPIKQINKKQFNFELYLFTYCKIPLNPGNSTWNTKQHRGFGFNVVVSLGWQSVFFSPPPPSPQGSRVGVGVGPGRPGDSTQKSGGFLVDMVIFVSKPVFCLVCLCSKYNGTFGCQSKVWWNFVCCVS